MRILLDENVPAALRHEFPTGLEVETVSYRGWSGLDNGDLFREAEKQFDVLITLDSNIEHQQNLEAFDLRFVIVKAGDGRLEDLRPLMGDVVNALYTSGRKLAVVSPS